MMPRWAATGTGVIGILVLLGWALDIEFLQRIMPGLVAMNPATAVAFVLAGVALWSLQAEPNRLLMLRAAQACAGGVALIGLLKLCALLGGPDACVDQWLFAAKLETGGIIGFPNRMAPNTALNFLLAGSALLLLGVKTRRGAYLAQLLAIAVALTSLLAVIGYVFNSGAFYRVGAFIPMALHTALTFLMLAGGILIARSDQGPAGIFTSSGMDGIVARRLLPAAIVAPIVLGWLRLAGENAGLYGTTLGVSLLVTSIIVVFVALIGWTAAALGRAEAKRAGAEAGLQATARQLEAAQQANERILDYSLDVICTIDEFGRFRQVSPACEKIWGHTPAALIGQQYIDFVCPEDVATTRQAALDIVSGTATSNFENRCIRKDGTVVPMIWSAVWSAADRMVFCVARDNTERKRIEEELNRFFTLSLDMICIAGFDGYYKRLNPAWTKALGYSSEELMSRPFLEFVHPDDRAATIAETQSLTTGNDTVSFENRYICQDGSIRWLTWIATPTLDHSLIYAAARDVTERRQAEEELRAGEERTRSIIDTAHDAFVSMNSDSLIADWNHQAEAVFGWTREEALGRPLAETIIPLQYREAHHRGLRHFLNTGEGPVLNKAFEITALHRDGREFPIELSISPLRWGQTYIFSAFIRDITERKEAETALRVEITERQMAMEALREVYEIAERRKEEAEAASRAKSQFLANMSHEIRTPMNGVLGPIGLLLDSQLSRQQRELTEIARSSAESLLNIINDILDLSKIEVGKLDIEPIPFNLLLAIEEAASMMVAKAEEKNLDLIVRYPTSVPRQVVADPGRIRQVLANLISNAIKFTHRGHVLVNVEALEQTDEEVALRVSVEDTGIGIEAGKIDHVFGRFNQADTSTTRRYGGTGLGLSISKQLVELMGGEIGATSTAGRGSIFWFTLRLPIEHELPLSALSPADRKADLRGARVLIVDDNAVNLRVLREQLHSWELRNESCAVSGEAMAMLRAARNAGDPFQIAILDHQMPDLDGEALGLAIKADAELRDTILVMLTSLGHRGDATRLKAAGFAAYLMKPARQSDLFTTFLDVWTKSQAGKDAQLITRRSLAETRLAEARLEEARVAETPKAASHWAGTRVLLVEDNVVNQKVASMILQSFGCQVEIAANGRQAVAMLGNTACDLIFMDCEMPEMDGYEATAAIRRRRDGKQLLPIIAITAKATRDDRERCLDAGMDDYMSKPVKAADFQVILQRWAPRDDETIEIDGEASGTNGNEAETQWEAPLSTAIAPSTAAIDSTSLDDTVVAQMRSLAAATDVTLLEQIFESFLSDGEARLADLSSALEKQDAASLHGTAHALKGAAANIGAPRMAGLAAQLQDLGESGALDGAAALIEELQTAFAQVRLRIVAELAKSP